MNFYFAVFFSLSNKYTYLISRSHHYNLNLLTNTKKIKIKPKAKKTTKNNKTNQKTKNILGFAFFINNVTMSQHYCFPTGLIYLFAF